MSLVCRWPPFDYMTHSNYFYQRIISDQIMRVSYIDKAAKKQIGSDMYIMPTDDERLKIVIISQDTVPGVDTLDTTSLIF